MERRTDELAIEPYVPLGDDGIDTLVTQLRPHAERVATADEIPYPNPMGLPRTSGPA